MTNPFSQLVVEFDPKPVSVADVYAWCKILPGAIEPAERLDGYIRGGKVPLLVQNEGVFFRLPWERLREAGEVLYPELQKGLLPLNHGDGLTCGYRQRGIPIGTPLYTTREAFSGLKEVGVSAVAGPLPSDEELKEVMAEMRKQGPRLGKEAVVSAVIAKFPGLSRDPTRDFFDTVFGEPRRGRPRRQLAQATA